MILSHDQVMAMVKHVSGCCGKVSHAEVETLAKSHEKLRDLIKMLESRNGCWCSEIKPVHSALCQHISRKLK